MTGLNNINSVYLKPNSYSIVHRLSYLHKYPFPFPTGLPTFPAQLVNATGQLTMYVESQRDEATCPRAHNVSVAEQLCAFSSLYPKAVKKMTERKEEALAGIAPTGTGMAHHLHPEGCPAPLAAPAGLSFLPLLTSQ